MATLANVQTQFKYALQDKGKHLEDINSPATDDVRDKAIDEAVRWYEKKLPRLVTALIAVDSAGFYAVPADWLAGVSRVVSIEFPLNERPPRLLSPKSVGFQRRETGLFYYLDPNVSGSFRLTYTAKHAADLSSIDARHEPVIGKMAASIAAEAFAARYANTVSNNVDAVNYRSKEQEWRAVAKSIREQVERELRPDEWAALYEADLDTYEGPRWRT